MQEGTDTVVLYDELAHDDLLPLAWKAHAMPLDAGAAAALQDRNLRLLQACAAIEEHTGIEKQEEAVANAADLSRIDLKINLILDLVGQLVSATQNRPAPRSIRFNARGAEWTEPAPMPAVSSHGVLELFIRESLPQPLVLPAQIVSVGANGQVEARFTNVGEPVASLMEKLAFRRHRRRIAGARQPIRRT